MSRRPGIRRGRDQLGGLALKPIGALVGMLGATVIALGSIVTALAYTGSKGERYSPLTHWVSELGQVGVSELAIVFNLGLIVGGICFSVFILALGLARRTGLAWLYTPIGIAAGIAGLFVGVFPMNNLDLHGIAALTFFNLGWICVGLASWDFVRKRDPRFPWWLAVIGALTVLAFIGFLSVLAPLLGGDGLAAPDQRPEPLWIVPTLEWAVVIGILAWTFAASFTWWRAERGRS
jgi:hypothetical membrane protein